MQLPDPEKLLASLAEQIRPAISKNTALVGIHTGGAWLAERLQQILSPVLPLGTLDISFYRDDYGKIGLSPKVKPSDIPFDVDEREIILVDDVLYTGRTIRAAMNVLFDYGRPASIRLAALVDRGGRQLPISAQFVGAELTVEAGKILELQRDEDGRLSFRLRERERS